MLSQRDSAETRSDRELVETWRRLVFESIAGDVRELLAAFPDRRQLSVPFEECGTDYRFTAPLLNEPNRTLAAGRRALSEFADERFDVPVASEERIYLRLTGVPDSTRYPIGSIRAAHLNRLLAVDGTVEAVDRPRPRIVTARFECERCGVETAIAQRERHLRQTRRCSNCNTAGTLALAPDRCDYVDAQRLHLTDGERTLPVAVEHDLAGRFSVGDRIDLVAIPRARPDGETAFADLELEAIDAELRDDDSTEGGTDR